MIQRVWLGDSYLSILAVQRDLDTWVEFTIRRPTDEPLVFDPVVEGIVTPGRFEWQTLGMYDGSEELLVLALRMARVMGRDILEGR